MLAHGCARCAPWEGQGAERCHRGRGCRGHPGTSRRAGARVRKLTWAAAPRAARKGRVEAWRATGREVAGRRAGGPGRSSAGLGDRRQPRAWGAWADGQAAGGGGQWSSPGRLAASLGASSGPLGSRTEGPRGLGRAGAEPGRGAQLRGFRGAVWKAGRPTLVVCHENRARRRWWPASSRGAGWGPLTESRARPLSPRLGDGPGASEALVTSRACGPGQPRRGPSGHGATRHVAEDGAAAA